MFCKRDEWKSKVKQWLVLGPVEDPSSVIKNPFFFWSILKSFLYVLMLGYILQVLFAGSLIKNDKVIHEALIAAMSKKATIVECIEAIEKAA